MSKYLINIKTLKKNPSKKQKINKEILFIATKPLIKPKLSINDQYRSELTGVDRHSTNI